MSYKSIIDNKPTKEIIQAGWRSIIGLEIHIELKTQSKMFCGCSAAYFGHKPNTHVCPVCLGLPGALPVANKKAIGWVVLCGLALDCQIPLFSKFDRKNYFYPDLPKGYQISQYDLPLAVKGRVKMDDSKIIRITRVHLEEDTAKLIHATVKGKGVTLIDFNRAGVPLMEVVTEPDIKSPQEAKEFLKKLRQIVRYLGISDCDMEKGSMRLEVNVSLQKSGISKLPDYKVEIKNLNSFRFVEKALEYEIKRQLGLIKKGQKPLQETRGWNEVEQMTYSQRWKEEAQDYRYFPEPDLPPIHWQKKEIERIKKSLIELPDEKGARFQKQYKLSLDQIKSLIESRERADYFEEAVKVGCQHQIDAKEIANVLVNKRIGIEKILPAELIKILVKKRIKPTIKGKELEKIVNKVIRENRKAVEDYKKGKITAVEFLVGQIARATKGQADPNQTRKVLLEKLR